MSHNITDNWLGRVFFHMKHMHLLVCVHDHAHLRLRSSSKFCKQVPANVVNVKTRVTSRVTTHPFNGKNSFSWNRLRVHFFPTHRQCRHPLPFKESQFGENLAIRWRHYRWVDEICTHNRIKPVTSSAKESLPLESSWNGFEMLSF